MIAIGTLVFLTSFLVSFLSAPVLIRIALRLRIVDAPDGLLKKHTRTTPYLGGFAIFLGTFSSLLFIAPLQIGSVAALFGGSLLLLAVGIIDDVIALRPYQKLFGQVLAVFCFLQSGFYFKEHFFQTLSLSEEILWKIFSSFWMLSVINAFNLIDVMDGLAVTVAIVTTALFLFAAVILKSFFAAMVCLALLGGLIAFLWYNKPLAKMYLGDAGALFLGGMLAIIPFLCSWGTYAVYGFFAPLIILSLPLIEICMLIIIRTTLKIPFYQGSRHHFSHYLQNRGWSAARILGATASMGLFLGSAALFFSSGTISLASFVAFAALLMAFWLWIVYKK